MPDPIKVVVTADGGVAVKEFDRVVESAKAVARAVGEIGSTSRASAEVFSDWSGTAEAAARNVLSAWIPVAPQVEAAAGAVAQAGAAAAAAEDPVSTLISTLGLITRDQYDQQFSLISDAITRLRAEGITAGPVIDQLHEKLAALEKSAKASGLQGKAGMRDLAQESIRAAEAMRTAHQIGGILGPTIRKGADVATDGLKMAAFEALGLGGKMGFAAQAAINLSRVPLKALEESLENAAFSATKAAAGAEGLAGKLAAARTALTTGAGGAAAMGGALLALGASLGILVKLTADVVKEENLAADARRNSTEATERQNEQFERWLTYMGMTRVEAERLGVTWAGVIEVARRDKSAEKTHEWAKALKQVSQEAQAITHFVARMWADVGKEIDEANVRLTRQFSIYGELRKRLEDAVPEVTETRTRALVQAVETATSRMGSGSAAIHLYRDDLIKVGEEALAAGKKLDLATASLVTRAGTDKIVGEASQFFPEAVIERARQLAGAYDEIIKRTGSTKVANAALKDEIAAVTEQGKTLGIVLPDAFHRTAAAAAAVVLEENRLWGATEEGVARFKTAMAEAEARWPSFVAATQAAVDASVAKINELIAKQTQISLGGGEDDVIVDTAGAGDLIQQAKDFRKNLSGAQADYAREFSKAIAAGNITAAENVLEAIRDASKVINAYGGQAGGPGDKLAGLAQSLAQLLGEFKRAATLPGRQGGGGVTGGREYFVHNYTGPWTAPGDGAIVTGAPPAERSSSGFGGGSDRGFAAFSSEIRGLRDGLRENARAIDALARRPAQFSISMSGREVTAEVNEHNARGENRRTG